MRSPPTVLVVDDDDAIRVALQRALALEGFAVATAPGGADALEQMRADPAHVVVLDVVLPDVDGVTVTRRLRAGGVEVPILILSALDRVADRVAGLRAGADDCLTKPFELEELVARLHALLRRQPSGPATPVRVGDLVVDPLRRSARLGHRDLDLTRREFDLLETLAVHRGVVLTRSQLLEQVWGYRSDVQTNVVDVFVGCLRRKLEQDGTPRMVRTVRGVGFVLRA